MSSQCGLIADDMAIGLGLKVALLGPAIAIGRANAPNASIAHASSVTTRKPREGCEQGWNRTRIASSIIIRRVILNRIRISAQGYRPM